MSSHLSCQAHQSFRLSTLSPNDFEAFDALIREKGQELLEILDDWLGQHETKGGHKLPPNESIRTGVGIFHFVEDSPELVSPELVTDEQFD